MYCYPYSFSRRGELAWRHAFSVTSFMEFRLAGAKSVLRDQSGSINAVLQYLYHKVYTPRQAEMVLKVRTHDAQTFMLEMAAVLADLNNMLLNQLGFNSVS